VPFVEGKGSKKNHLRVQEKREEFWVSGNKMTHACAIGDYMAKKTFATTPTLCKKGKKRKGKTEKSQEGTGDGFPPQAPRNHHANKIRVMGKGQCSPVTFPEEMGTG